MKYDVVKGARFLRWLTRLRDKRAQAQILIRIDCRRAQQMARDI